MRYIMKVKSLNDSNWFVIVGRWSGHTLIHGAEMLPEQLYYLSSTVSQENDIKLGSIMMQCLPLDSLLYHLFLISGTYI